MSHSSKNGICSCLFTVCAVGSYGRAPPAGLPHPHSVYYPVQKSDITPGNRTLCQPGAVCIMEQLHLIIRVFCLKLYQCLLTQQPLKPVGYCFHPWHLDGQVSGRKKLVLPVSQKS